MKQRLLPLFAGLGFVISLLYLAFIPTASGQTVDSWADNTRGTGFKWETAAEWSLGIPPSLAQSQVLITNRFGNGVFGRTVNIDATTASSFPGTMTISNLTLSSPSPTFNNALLVSNTGATPLTTEDSLTVSTHGVVSINNASVLAGAQNGTLTVDGTLLLNSGTLETFFGCVGLCFPVATPTIIGSTSTGVFTVAAGRWLSGPVQVGSSLSSYGTLTIAGGSITMATGLGPILLALNVVNGTVLLTGGVLQTSSDVQVGSSGGAGQMTVSNASWLAGNLSIGVSGGDGTLTIAGGTVSHNQIELGFDTNSLGALWLTGGQLTASDIRLGRRGYGQMTVSNGTTAISTITLGIETGSAGTLTIAGGTLTVEETGELSVGNGTGSTGVVWVTGGLLVVTNGLAVVGDQGSGQMTVSNGTVQIDSLNLGRPGGIGILTAAGGISSIYSNMVIGHADCSGYGQVNVTGGSVFVTNAAHNAVLDLENGPLTLNSGMLVVDILISTNHCATFLRRGGTLVIGGVTNLFTPLPFGITSIANVGHSIFIQWQTQGGVTNIVQATNGNPDGSYNTNFVDISPPLLIDGPSTDVWNDIGGATNKPSRFYRIRQVP